MTVDMLKAFDWGLEKMNFKILSVREIPCFFEGTGNVLA